MSLEVQNLDNETQTARHYGLKVVALEYHRLVLVKEFLPKHRTTSNDSDSKPNHVVTGIYGRYSWSLCLTLQRSTAFYRPRRLTA